MNTVLERMRQAREPFAWVMLIVSVGFVAVFASDFGWSVLHEHSGLFETSRRLSGSSLGISALAVTVAAVLLCRLVSPVTSHARLIGKLVAAVTCLSAVIDLVLAVLATVHAPGGAFGVIVGLVGDLLVVAVKAAVAVALVVLSRARDEDQGAPPAAEQHRSGTPD
ncbi:hypothetical protein [Acidipropionibacterium virtanenii]|uniref:Uncharacterized protein n=1 Tax=Acidipropionibacterium virtanenii TaxID=2057246 RepID=A0A344USM5_9ACTN|nr:hypothetical protein [Acidipropionibacterium virtanenii]AXE38273.1 hypothetical protein JS278_01090 [Acidipropionibacterium virtanenii]